MSHERVRTSVQGGAAVWLGCAAALLLGLAAAFLSYVHSSQMQQLRAQAAQTRARLIAHSVAEHLAGATSAGIPLHKLVGVEDYLDRWRTTHSEVMHIVVHDPRGKLLWRSRPMAEPSGSLLSTGDADVAHEGMVQAHVSLQLQNSSAQGRERIMALLAPAVLLFSVLAYLGARFACAQGPWLRNHGLRIIARWAIRGDYRQRLVLPQRRQFDLRVQEVAHAMRSVHERIVRMRLLIGSLRRTEPQQLRRDYLDQVLQQTEGSDRFSDAAPGTVRLVPVQAQSQWMALLVCLGAVSPLTYALRIFEFTAGNSAPWQQGLPAACLGMLGLAAAGGWKLSARLRIATLSVLILSLAALLLPPVALLLDSGLHPGWIAAWNGCFAGAAMAACTRAQTHPDAYPGYMHAQPEVPGAALRAWWGGVLWLAPALGYYAQAALRPTWALVALLLPIAVGLFFATRWDVAHSPWRVRMTDAPPPCRTDHIWHIRALGITGGLIAGPLLLELVAPGTPHLMQQCALGVGLAVMWVGPRKVGPRKVGPRKTASWRWPAIALLAITIQLTVLSTDALALPMSRPWLDLFQTLPAFLLGLLLAQGLAQAARTPQAATSQWLLLCGAFGAALSAVASALGMQGWPLVLAALLAIPAVRTKGPDVS